MPDYDANNMGQPMFNPFMSGMHNAPFYGNIMPNYGMYPAFGNPMHGNPMQQYAPSNMGQDHFSNRRGSVDIPVEHYDENGNKLN